MTDPLPLAYPPPAPRRRPALFPYAVASVEVFGGGPLLPNLLGFGQYPTYFGAVGLGISRGRVGPAAALVGGVHAVGIALWLLA